MNCFRSRHTRRTLPRLSRGTLGRAAMADAAGARAPSPYTLTLTTPSHSPTAIQGVPPIGRVACIQLQISLVLDRSACRSLPSEALEYLYTVRRP